MTTTAEHFPLHDTVSYSADFIDRMESLFSAIKDNSDGRIANLSLFGMHSCQEAMNFLEDVLREHKKQQGIQ